MTDPLLMLPGPTMVPERVLAAAARQQINHRGPQFARLLERLIERLRSLHLTRGTVALLNTSGTGGLEAAIVNTLSPGDRVLCCNCGWFGERFGDLARTYGVEVEEIRADWGRRSEADALAERLERDREHRFRAVLVTHNETATGVHNDLEALARARGDHPALLLVDAVSSLGAAELRMDEWGLDVVVSASQKALSAPPGIAFVALSDRALPALEQARSPRYYFDLRKTLAFHAKGQCPFTPVIPIFFSLDEALERLHEEGLEACWERHERNARAVRAGVSALGLELFAVPEGASPTVTSALIPEAIGAGKLLARMRDVHGVEISGGMGATAGKLVRIGHLGTGSSERSILATLAAMERTMRDLGSDVRPGVAVTAAQETLAAPAPVEVR